MKKTIRILDRRGQGLIEYMILLMLIAVISVAAVKKIGEATKVRLEKASKTITDNV